MHCGVGASEVYVVAADVDSFLPCSCELAAHNVSVINVVVPLSNQLHSVMADSDTEPGTPPDAVPAASPTPRRCVRVRSSGSGGSRSSARVKPPGTASPSKQPPDQPPPTHDHSTIVSEIMTCWESAARELGIKPAQTSDEAGMQRPARYATLYPPHVMGHHYVVT